MRWSEGPFIAAYSFSLTQSRKWRKSSRTSVSLYIIERSSDRNPREADCCVSLPAQVLTSRCVSVSLPSVELGCGLGVTLVLMLLLFVVYHVFWLELLLLYRSWFGTDERHTGEKQTVDQFHDHLMNRCS